jgi:hypothetical protein
MATALMVAQRDFVSAVHACPDSKLIAVECPIDGA